MSVACNVIIFVVLAIFGRLEASLTGYEFYQSSNTSAALVNCMVANGMQFIVPTGMVKYDTFDPNVCGLLKSAQDAGVQYRDVHYFPSPTSSSTGYDQMLKLVNGMKTCPNGVWSKRIWMDVSNSQYWYTPWRDIGYKQNINFFESMVDGCNKLATEEGVSCGIYSNSQQWQYIFNNGGYSYKPALSMPLWLIAIDGNPDVVSFNTFGGFTKAYAKTYNQEHLGFCGDNSAYYYKANVPQW